MKVVAIGHPDAVLGFSLAAVNGVVVTTTEEVNRALDDALSTSPGPERDDPARNWRRNTRLRDVAR